MRVSIKLLILSLLLLTVPYHRAQAQADTSRLDRYAYVLGSSLVFSLVDYIGYNLLKKAHGEQGFKAPASYRIAEGLSQAAITYFLYSVCGLKSAIAFNLIWWTWNDDFAYYEWEQLLDFFPWDHRSGSGLRFREYNSAGWTPIGLTRPQGSMIARSTLIAQAVIGFSISMPILW
ncbi:MAG TPA: hypothetical protein VFD13_02245 [Candidatus Kapabacteria bacterium]|nr:hypothetical protein [Candidatus Kapabacteria bacterium]